MSEKLNRRDFLRLSALTAAGVAAAACAKTPTEAPTQAPAVPTATPAAAAPTATPAPAGPSTQQAPMLSDMVSAGTLPALDERLPKDPEVVPVNEEIGTYGGVWRRASLGPNDGSNPSRLMHNGLLQWDITGFLIEPQFAKSWEIQDEGRTFLFQMREGAKWSTGDPYTTEDVMFWYEDQILNDELTLSKPSWLQIGGELGVFEAVDDYTFKLSFVQSYPLILDWFAQRTRCYGPKQYLSRFHPDYASKEDLDASIAEFELDDWVQLYGNRNGVDTNPDRPDLDAWERITPRSDPIFTLKRNPYLQRVDPEGKQLPYIDEISVKQADSIDVITLWAASGEIDMQSRHISLDSYPVFVDGAEQGDYRLILWGNSGGCDAGLMFNNDYDLKDPIVGKWTTNADFRTALSYAIDRDEVNQAAFLGLGEARQLCPPSNSPYYPGDEYCFRAVEYDPDKANQMLDDMGLSNRDADGYRTDEDGNTISLIILAIDAFGPWPDVGELAVSYWEAVGVKASLDVVERTLYYERMPANEMMIGIWNTGGAEHHFTYPYWAMPYGSSSRIGPLSGIWYSSGGTEGAEPKPEMLRLCEIQELAKGADAEQQAELGKEVFRINCEQLYTVGTIGLSPMVMGTVICKNNFRNVPEQAGNSDAMSTPGNANPEQFFWKS